MIRHTACMPASICRFGMSVLICRFLPAWLSRPCRSALCRSTLTRLTLTRSTLTRSILNLSGGRPPTLVPEAGEVLQPRMKDPGSFTQQQLINWPQVYHMSDQLICRKLIAIQIRYSTFMPILLRHTEELLVSSESRVNARVAEHLC